MKSKKKTLYSLCLISGYLRQHFAHKLSVLVILTLFYFTDVVEYYIIRIYKVILYTKITNYLNQLFNNSSVSISHSSRHHIIKRRPLHRPNRHYSAWVECTSRRCWKRQRLRINFLVLESALSVILECQNRISSWNCTKVCARSLF